MNYKTPMQNQNKGYGKESAKQERSNLLTMNPLSKHMSTPMQMGGSKMKGSAMMMKGAMKGDQSKSRLDYESPAKMGAKKGDQSKSRLDYEGSPAKKTKSRIEQDLGRNIAADKKAGKNKDAKAEAKQLMKVADGSQRY